MCCSGSGENSFSNSENMIPEVSLTVLKTFEGFAYSFTKLIAFDHKNRRTPQKSLII